MTKFILLIFFAFIVSADPVFAQEAKNVTRGTIRIKKPGSTRYIISAKTSLKKNPSVRIFRVRGYNYNFKEYFPDNYTSALYPLVFNYSGLVLTDENRQFSGFEIVSFEYEIFKSNVLYLKGVSSQWNLSFSIRKLSEMMTGSSVWIKNLSYKDKNGVLHKNEIGEFKIEKVK